MYQSSQPYPFLPTGRTINYVTDEHPFMIRARELCNAHVRYCDQPTSAILIKNGRIIAEGRNGGDNPPAVCIRKQRRIPTGQQYELCPGCDPKNHAEQATIRRTIETVNGADLYLYGHWWCCKACWEVMITAGIRNVYLVEGATERFGD